MDISTILPIVQSISRKFCNPNDAEDIAQTVILKLLQKPVTFRNDNPYPFLKKMVFSVLVDKSRRRTNSETPSSALLALIEVAKPEDTADRELISVVAEAMASLPVSERSAVKEFYFHDKPIADIASTLGVSPQAIKSRLFKARTRLRCKLAGYVGQEQEQEV